MDILTYLQEYIDEIIDDEILDDDIYYIAENLFYAHDEDVEETLRYAYRLRANPLLATDVGYNMMVFRDDEAFNKLIDIIKRGEFE